jgi:hypothetical protein
MTDGNRTKGENVMSHSSVDSLKIKATLLQKAKKKKAAAFSLKEAYLIIAKTAGYSSWKDMKDAYDLADLLNPPRWSALWKVWFGSKEEAIKHLTPETFLLPYRNHFFICDADYLSALSIPSDDVDLLKVGNDWSEPKDKEAWGRLIKKIKNS